MSSLNQIMIIGNLGQDPEVKYMPSGDAVCNLSVATTEKWKDKSGNQDEHTEWHKIDFFGKLAEVAAEYLKKGSKVYIQGRVRTRKWQDKTGADRYSTSILADKLVMLDSRQGTSGYSAAHGGGDPRYERKPEPRAKPQGDPAARTPDKPKGEDPFEGMDDDLPF